MSKTKFLVAMLLISSSVVASSQEVQENNDQASSEEDADRPGYRGQNDRICFRRGISSYRLIEEEDNVVLLERGVNNWYRVELTGGRCTYRNLRSAQGVAIQSPRLGGCVMSGDILIFSDTAFSGAPGAFATQSRCTILGIEEVKEEDVG